MDIALFIDQVTNSFCRLLPKSKIHSIDALTPDASSRRYFRIKLIDQVDINNSKVDTIIAMLFLSKMSPESGGNKKISSDLAVIQLGKYLRDFGVSVPTIFFEDLDNNLIFLEDLGDLSLADYYQNNFNLKHYKNAIKQIKLIQEIKNDNKFFVFKREFAYEQYRIELNEISDFYLNLSNSEKKNIEYDFDKLSNEISLLPKVLSHRDFHSWNLMVDTDDQLRVIDYQDALMATKYYDLVALLNDRDTDSILGEDNYIELLKFYYSSFNKPNNFFYEFLLVSLQRDLKVVGRFAKLDKNNIAANYSRWIPGTLNRISRTLNLIKDEYRFLYDILSQHCSENFSVNSIIDLNKFNEKSI